MLQPPHVRPHGGRAWRRWYLAEQDCGDAAWPPGSPSVTPCAAGLPCALAQPRAPWDPCCTLYMALMLQKSIFWFFRVSGQQSVSQTLCWHWQQVGAQSVCPQQDKGTPTSGSTRNCSPCIFPVCSPCPSSSSPVALGSRDALQSWGWPREATLPYGLCCPGNVPLAG